MQPGPDSRGEYVASLQQLKVRTLLSLYSPECVEGEFSEVHLQDPG